MNAKERNRLNQKRFRDKHGGVNLHREVHGRGDTDLKHHLKKAYGMSLEEYEAMLVEQNGVCAICHQPETMLGKHGVVRRLSVDHDHVTDKVRGLLCSDCNTTIGKVSESIPRLLSMVAYLRRASAV